MGVLQGVLALLFLYTGVFKLVASPDKLSGPMSLPLAFLRFLGACEVLGAFGLVLPTALRIRPGLTPLAAALLVIIMIGATVLTAYAGQTGLAIGPAVIGVLLVLVAYGRWRVVPVAPK